MVSHFRYAASAKEKLGPLDTSAIRSGVILGDINTVDRRLGFEPHTPRGEIRTAGEIPISSDSVRMTESKR
jgi:hypothetical protein